MYAGLDSLMIIYQVGLIMAVYNTLIIIAGKIPAQSVWVAGLAAVGSLRNHSNFTGLT